MISVIIPSYRPGDYIWKCLDSLDEQTLAKDEYEIIIVLNGCNEPYYGTLSVGIKKYGELHIQLIQIDEGGVSNARNIGLDTANGEYIAFIDDDDWVSSVYLEDMLGRILPDTIVASNEIDVNEDTNEQCDSYITKAFRKCEPLGKVSLFKGRSLMSSSCCKLIPYSLIKDKRFDTNFRLSEDSLFMTSLSSKIKSIVLSDKRCIYYRRVHMNSASRSVSVQDRRSQVIKLICANIKLYFNDVINNNILFFASRIVAALYKLVKKTWI